MILLTENKPNKRNKGRPSKAQRLQEFSILNWRAELFLMISDELADIKKRELSIMKDDDDGYAKEGGSGGQSEKAGKISMALEHSKSLIEGAIKAIDKTKKEADLEQKLKEAERDKRKLELALKRIEKEETKKGVKGNGDN